MAWLPSKLSDIANVDARSDVFALEASSEILLVNPPAAGTKRQPRPVKDGNLSDACVFRWL
jgi:hypothetical protein